MCTWSMLHSDWAREAQEEEEKRKEEGKGGKEEGSWGWGQLEVKLFGAAQNSHLHNGQEKWESMLGVMAVLVGEKETDWLGR